MLLSSGAKILVSHRRLYEGDAPRLFVGKVVDYADGVAKARGFSWARDPSKGYVRNEHLRTKLVPINSGTMIVYELDREVDVEALTIEIEGAHTVMLSDGAKFRLDISERP